MAESCMVPRKQSRATIGFTYYISIRNHIITTAPKLVEAEANYVSGWITERSNVTAKNAMTVKTSKCSVCRLNFCPYSGQLLSWERADLDHVSEQPR